MIVEAFKTNAIWKVLLASIIIILLYYNYNYYFLDQKSEINLNTVDLNGEI